MMRAPTSGLLRQWRCHSPSASVKERSERRWWMRRRRASRSTWAAAFVRAHCSRSSASGERRAASSRSCSSVASDPAASAMAHACSADSSPRRAAAAVSGRDSSRRAVSMVAAACTTLVPVRRASWCAADRSPSFRHEPVSATRAAARPLTVAAIFSIRDACSTTAAAWDADSTAASKSATYSLSDPRSSVIPTPMAVPTVRERATYRGK